jgi:hypothetical protein
MLFLICDSVLFPWYFLVIYLVVLWNFELWFRWALLLLILRNIQWVLINHLDALSFLC